MDTGAIDFVPFVCGLMAAKDRQSEKKLAQKISTQKNNTPPLLQNQIIMEVRSGYRVTSLKCLKNTDQKVLIPLPQTHRWNKKTRWTKPNLWAAGAVSGSEVEACVCGEGNHMVSEAVSGRYCQKNRL